jgi:type I site-specific restriction-modification system R (restriction) subunit
MRSYQYYAAHAISDSVAKINWHGKNQLGGYIWHTTGSGKTMTSFKSAQLIANSKDADKVIFLMDRIELGTQSLKEYRGFAEDNDDVQATENTSKRQNPHSKSRHCLTRTLTTTAVNRFNSRKMALWKSSQIIMPALTNTLKFLPMPRLRKTSRRGWLIRSRTD